MIRAPEPVGQFLHSHSGVILAQRARMQAHAEAAAAEFRRSFLSEANRAHFEARAAERDAWRDGPRMTRDDASREAASALRDVERSRDAVAAQRVHSAMSEADIRTLARRRGELMGERIDAKVFTTATVPGVLLDWLSGELVALDAQAVKFQGARRTEGEQLASMFARARCHLWWRRKLRRAVVRLREQEGVEAGEIGAMGGRQPYVTNDTNARMQHRREDGKAMLANTHIENADGYSMTLEHAAEKSTANPAIRRGELMTRVVGCERIADMLGHPGVFLTLTAPSRFHSKGGRNPRYRGAKPRDSHEWLCKTWDRVRARLGREGIKFYGFRVAEPHRDACTHWHAMFWCAPEHMDELVATVREWWVRECDPSPWHVVHAAGCVNARDSDRCLFSDPGRGKYRVNAKPIDAGGAAGYCAKYISKNIDDKGVSGHIDHDGEDTTPKAVHGGTARRVLTWAQAHGIRQFQPLGQPPVTVWRELRRVSEADQAGATGRLAMAFEAANRKGARKASWAQYVIAQGGLMKGREYLLRIATETLKREGRYETTEEPRPVGVYDVATVYAVATDKGPVRGVVTHLSARQEWKPRGAWARENNRKSPGESGAPVVPPWTRVNNCTQIAGLERREWLPRTAEQRERGDKPVRAPLLTWRQIIEPGGSASILKEPPCPTPIPPSPASLLTHSPTSALSSRLRTIRQSLSA